jgi:hypothetical protein
MTDSASQSLVDLDLLIAVCEKAARSSFAVTIDPVPVLPVVKAAAARITELEAERDRIERNRDMWKGQCERQAESLTAMRDLLTRVDGLGRTNAWRRMPTGGSFIATSLGQDIAAAIRSLPPLAKRGDQEKPQIAESRAAENSETKSAGGEA